MSKARKKGNKKEKEKRKKNFLRYNQSRKLERSITMMHENVAFSSTNLIYSLDLPLGQHAYQVDHIRLSFWQKVLHRELIHKKNEIKADINTL